MIRIQSQDFDHGEAYAALRASMQSDGAIVTFTGLVRDFSDHKAVTQLTLEHYPGMTEKVLSEICNQANARWHLGDTHIIHRVGTLHVNDQIVFVGVSSEHRASAFEACQFIMDNLKTTAPFWKKQGTKDNMQWVASKQSDHEAKDRW